VKRPPSRRSVERMRERERNVGLEPDDEAARWLEDHEPKVEPAPPKAARKSKALHRWRQQRGGEASPPK
jgi:hypothetical protein